MKRAALLLALLAGCGGDRFRIVDGPARLTIGATPFTPEVSVELEAGGRAWFGPDAPPAVAGPIAPDVAIP